MKMDSLKDRALRRVDSYDILDYYLKPYHEKGALKQGQHISNPFLLPTIQKTPSFNIYLSKSGSWRYNDFATGDQGDCFNLVMRLYGLGFYEALQLVVRDFVIGI